MGTWWLHINVDGWTDGCNRSIIKFLVNSSKCAFYLYSIDASSEQKTVDYITKTLEDGMVKVGVENFVQVCTDDARNFVLVRKNLMAEYDHVLLTPCVAHILDLTNEDFGKI